MCGRFGRGRGRGRGRCCSRGCVVAMLCMCRVAPCRVVSCRVLSCRSVRRRAVPCHLLVSCRAVLCCAVPCHAVLGRVVPPRVVSYLVMPRVMPCRVSGCIASCSVVSYTSHETDTPALQLITLKLLAGSLRLQIWRDKSSSRCRRFSELHQPWQPADLFWPTLKQHVVL